MSEVIINEYCDEVHGVFEVVAFYGSDYSFDRVTLYVTDPRGDVYSSDSLQAWTAIDEYFRSVVDGILTNAAAREYWLETLAQASADAKHVFDR